MGKTIDKTTHTLKICTNFNKEWETMTDKAAGSKGKQLSAGILAWMALYRIDKGLASELVNPDLTSELAAGLILKRGGLL